MDDKFSGSLRGDSVTPVLAGDIPERLRFCYDFFIKMSPPEVPVFRRFQCCLIFSGQRGEIQTIEQRDLITSGPQNGPQVKKSERLHPEVVGGKVVDPGVD